MSVWIFKIKQSVKDKKETRMKRLMILGILACLVIFGLAAQQRVQPITPAKQPAPAQPQTQTRGGGTLREVRREFTTPGSHSFVYNERFPATVHVYLLGAGGGAQGGHSKAYQQGMGTRTERGTGAAAGGGAVLYTSFEITAPSSFDIVVGAGGEGGARHHKGVGGSWESGRPGAAGGATTVRFGALTFTAQGGSGGGGNGAQAISGGAGGVSSSRPSGQTGLLTWVSNAGGNGSNGGHNADLREQQGGGNTGSRAGQIPAGNGPGSPFASSLNPGHGGRGGYDSASGSNGHPGRVLFVITYFQ
jgi:hypothetical protein